jgi:hypothetical protein
LRALISATCFKQPSSHKAKLRIISIFTQHTKRSPQKICTSYGCLNLSNSRPRLVPLVTLHKTLFSVKKTPFIKPCLIQSQQQEKLKILSLTPSACLGKMKKIPPQTKAAFSKNYFYTSEVLK